MADKRTFDDEDDPLEDIEPDQEDVDPAEVDEEWEAADPMDGEAPSG